MKLDPNNYTCPDHHTDLASQVQEALDDAEGTPLAYDRPPLRLLGNVSARARKFEVIVICSGASGGQAHSLTCTGTYTQ